MRCATPHGQDGFTMIEMLIALSVFLLILMGVFQIFEPSNAAYVSSERKLGVQQNARIAMDMIVRQIRMAGYFPENFDTDTTNNVANSVQLATDAAMAVAGDLDQSGASNAFLFCLSPAGLRRVKGALGAATVTPSPGRLRVQNASGTSSLDVCVNPSGGTRIMAPGSCP